MMKPMGLSAPWFDSIDTIDFCLVIPLYGLIKWALIPLGNIILI